MTQPDLFGPETLPAPSPEVAELAQAIPPKIRFGTSTWTYDGWFGRLPPALSRSATRSAARRVHALSTVSDGRDRQRVLRSTFGGGSRSVCASTAAGISLREQGVGTDHGQAVRTGCHAGRPRRHAQPRFPERGDLQGECAGTLQPRVPRSRRLFRIRIPGDAGKRLARPDPVGRSAG